MIESPGNAGRPVSASKMHASEREDVGPGIDLALAEDLLRRHVAGGADELSGGREVLGATAGAGDTEVDELRARRITLDEVEVARLDVAVNDARGVRLREPLGGAVSHLQHRAHSERALRQALGEIEALEPLHREPEGGPLCPLRDVAHDGRVLDLGEQASLAKEAIDHRVVTARQHLERNRPREHGVERAEHGAHTASPRDALDDEPTCDEVSRMHYMRSLARWSLRNRVEARLRCSDACSTAPPSGVDGVLVGVDLSSRT
jgi:hypothetical protein